MGIRKDSPPPGIAKQISPSTSNKRCHKFQCHKQLKSSPAHNRNKSLKTMHHNEERTHLIQNFIVHFDAYHPSNKETFWPSLRRFISVSSLAIGFLFYALGEHMSFLSIAPAIVPPPIFEGFADKIDAFFYVLALLIISIPIALVSYIYTATLLRIMGINKRPNIYRMVIGNASFFIPPYAFIAIMIFLDRARKTWTGEEAYTTIGLSALASVFLIGKAIHILEKRRAAYIASFFVNSTQKKIHFGGKFGLLLFALITLYYYDVITPP